MPGLPIGDPQFWMVTAGAVVALVLIVRRARNKTSSEAGAPPCEHCAGHPAHHGAVRPRAPGPDPPGGTTSR